MPVSWAMLVAPTATSCRMASRMVRTLVVAFHASPMETVRVGLPIQLNLVGSNCACGTLSSGAKRKPRLMKPQTVPSCGPMP
jgi:ABC-type Mn2+/Zn2+ transport system permease subunit